MYDIVTGLLASMNLIEVKGQQNLALLYNAIDTLKQMQTAFKPKAEEKTDAEDNTVK